MALPYHNPVLSADVEGLTPTPNPGPLPPFESYGSFQSDKPSPALDEKSINEKPSLEEAQTEESHTDAPPTNVPWKYKVVCLFTVCTFSIGQVWTDAALSPLKATLRKELGITNSQYGVIDNASGIVNCVSQLASDQGCLSFVRRLTRDYRFSRSGRSLEV